MFFCLISHGRLNKSRFHREAVSASALKVADAVMKKALLALRLDALKREMSLEVLWLMRNV